MQMRSLKSSGGNSAGMSRGGSGLAASSGELPDVGSLESGHQQLLWGVAAVAALSRSAAVAARFASLKALAPALLTALKVIDGFGGARDCASGARGCGC